MSDALGLDPLIYKCVAHATHSPEPWVLESHHVVPQAWTHKLGMPEWRRVPICPTGHDQVHRAIAARIAGVPHRPLTSAAKALVLEAMQFYETHSGLYGTAFTLHEELAQ